MDGALAERDKGQQLESSSRIKRVTIHPRYILLIDRGHGSLVPQLSEGTILDGLPEVQITFGSE